MSLKKNSISVISHPILSRVWNYGKGDEGVNPSEVASKSMKLYSWVCSDCRCSFMATAEETLRHKGVCSDCFKRMAACHYKNSATKRYGTIADIPEIMKLWCEENPDPHTIRKASSVKVKIHCADCGNIVEHTAKDLYRHKWYYCKDCANKRRAIKYQKRIIEKNGSCYDDPEIMKVWDFESNTFDPKYVPLGSRYKIHCKCPVCGEKWISYVYARKGKKALCQKCAKRHAIKKRDSKKRRILISNPQQSFGTQKPCYVSWWNSELNGNLTPFEIPAHSHRLFYWKCPYGHAFQASAQSMLARRFCPICRPTIHSSFIEMAIAFYLCKVTKIEQWKKIQGTRQSMDIYLPEQRTCVEYDGVLYHNNMKQASRDLRKDEILAEKGIRLIRIKEWASDVHNENTIFYDYNKGNLQRVLDILCDMLSIARVQVDLGRDTSAIYKELYPKVVPNSISAKSPELVPYWDIEANGGITADKVNAYSAKFFSWRCPKCNARWVYSPIGMKRRKHLCQECDPYNHHKGTDKYGNK